MLVVVRTSRLSCRETEKAPIFAPVQESPGESKFMQIKVTPLCRHPPAIASDGD
jgi:hypothetical protein